MLSQLLPNRPAGSVPLQLIRGGELQDWIANASAVPAAWIKSTGYRGEAGEVALLPGMDGALAGVLVGIGAGVDYWSLAGLPEKLPRGAYHIEGALTPEEATRVAIGWALACYRFTRYRQAATEPPSLVVPEGADRAAVERLVNATGLVRDMVNTPAEDMGPAEIAEIALALAREHGAQADVIVGDALLERGFPMVHAVGRAASRAPRLIELSWSGPGIAPDAPKLALVGKGVCFDSGGLDMKSSSNMLLMKKDMGGAAHALALASMVMAARLPVRLHVVVPAVENAVSGNAFRPLDVLRSRKGLTVEIGNTDAEGRLILGDALAAAAEGRPDLMIDFATLTGAARVALGPELPALFCSDDGLAEELLAAGRVTADPMWRLPLWSPYRKLLDSKIADIGNASSGTFAGSILAALFLKEFVPSDIAWAHLDLYAWNATSRPGRPEGGEAMTLRAVFAVLERRYVARKR